MAHVSLNGIRIEIEHRTEPGSVTARLEAFAADLAENRFTEWGVRIDRRPDGALALVGERDGNRFLAEVMAEAERVVLQLSGQVHLGRLKLTLAGGEEGVRRRVSDEIRRALHQHLT